MPEIEGIYQEFRDRGVAVVAIDIMEAPSTVRDFVAKGRYSFDFAIDATGDVAIAYRVDSIPASFFINKDGVITAKHVGGLRRSDMARLILDAMK